MRFAALQYTGSLQARPSGTGLGEGEERCWLRGGRDRGTCWQGRSERPLSVWQREEIQAVLRAYDARVEPVGLDGDCRCAPRRGGRVHPQLHDHYRAHRRQVSARPGVEPRARWKPTASLSLTRKPQASGVRRQEEAGGLCQSSRQRRPVDLNPSGAGGPPPDGAGSPISQSPWTTSHSGVPA